MLDSEIGDEVYSIYHNSGTFYSSSPAGGIGDHERLLVSTSI